MKSVSMNKSRLLEILRQNREMHIAEFTSAMIEYRKDLVAELEKRLEIAQSGGDVEHFINLVVPMTHEKEYNTAIKMLEYDEREIVDLTNQEFQQYVEDEWSWKQAFAASTSYYNSKA